MVFAPDANPDAPAPTNKGAKPQAAVKPVATGSAAEGPCLRADRLRLRFRLFSAPSAGASGCDYRPRVASHNSSATSDLASWIVPSLAQSIACDHGTTCGVICSPA